LDLSRRGLPAALVVGVKHPKSSISIFPTRLTC
jgi:hypothetical protein